MQIISNNLKMLKTQSHLQYKILLKNPKVCLLFMSQGNNFDIVSVDIKKCVEYC